MIELMLNKISLIFGAGILAVTASIATTPVTYIFPTATIYFVAILSVNATIKEYSNSIKLKELDYAFNSLKTKIKKLKFKDEMYE